MAVYAHSLKQPAGYLPATWFDDIALGVWIAEGIVKAASIADAYALQDEAISAWAYYRAYHLKAQEKEDLPQSSSLSGAYSESYGADRSKLWEGEAKKWLNAHNDLLAGTSTSAPTYLFTTAAGRRGR